MSHHKKSKLEELIYSILQSKGKRVLVGVITLLLFAQAVYLIPIEVVKAKMLPGKDSDNFSIYIDLPEGSSLTQTKSVAQCVVDKLKLEKEITDISIFLGEGQPLDFAGMVKGSMLKSNEHEAELMVNILKKHDRSEDSYLMVQRLRPILQSGCSNYNANIKMVEPPAGPPVLASIVMEVYGGDSLESRENMAKKIAEVFKKTDTLVDVDTLLDDDFKSFGLILNNNKILESAVGIEQVKKILYLAFEGMDIGFVNEANAENQIPIFLRLDDSRVLKSATKDELLNKLSQLKLMNQKGMMVPMSELVTVIEKRRNHIMTSKNLKPMINVVAETDMESQIYPLLDARDTILDEFSSEWEVEKADMLNLRLVNKTTGETFDLVWDGELKVTIDTFIELGGAFIGALVLIFLLMVVYYQNFGLAGGIVLASFTSLIGVIWGHFVMDLITSTTFYLTATSLIGYIGLIGINSRNSLLIIDFARQLIEEKGIEFDRAIAISTATRAKPILLTVLAIVFASTLLAGDAVFGGLGVALIGGTLAAYLVSIFLVPVLIYKPLRKLYYEENSNF
jgi:multidrug efflux pump subunit AcrB